MLIALYENETVFEYRALTPEHPEAFSELEALWPFKLFPVLVDGERTVIEASIIIEHLEVHRPGPVRLIPEDPRAAIEARFMDRVFDNYVATPQAKFVFDRLRPVESRDPFGVAEARARLDTAYRWLDEVIGGTRVGGGRCLQPRRLRGRTRLVLRRLDSSDPQGMHQRSRLSTASAGTSVIRPRGGGSAPIPPAFPPRRAGPGLTEIDEGATFVTGRLLGRTTKRLERPSEVAFILFVAAGLNPFYPSCASQMARRAHPMGLLRAH